MSRFLKQDVVLPNHPAWDSNVSVHHLSLDLIIGSSESLLVVVWRGATTRDGAIICRDALLQNCAGRGCDFALMLIVEPQAQLPDNRTRELLATTMREANQWVQVSSLVFEGSGFMAAGIRGIVTGITLLARQHFPHRVFENVHDAACFIERKQSPFNQTPFVASKTEASVNELRRRGNEKLPAR
jgi:hypothetical protein